MALVRKRYFFRSLSALLFIGVIVLLATPPEFKLRFQSVGDDRTSLIRIERWKDGWKTLNENPILGIGHEAWTTYYRCNFSPEYKGTAMVHNIFLQCGTELGYLGLSVLGLMIFFSFRTNRKIRKQAKSISEPFYYFLTFGMDFGLIGLLISACFVTVLYYPYLWIYFAMISSMQISFNYGIKSNSFKQISDEDNAEIV